MKSAALAVLLLALPAGQDPAPLPKQPIKDFKITRKDPRHDLATGKDVEEITLILQGEEAIPISVERNREVLDLRGVKASYFTEPEKDKLSKEIQVTSRKGHFDNGARTLRLEDHVRVVRKNDDETPPRADTVLTASTLFLRFVEMYECPECRKRQLKTLQKRPGTCPDHRIPLKGVTITSVEADHDFDIAGPEGILSGEGLVTDDAINKDYHITRNGFVEFGGKGPGQGTDLREAPKFAQIFSRGPLEISGPEQARTVKGRDGMRVDRIDSSGTMIITAQQMTIETSPAKDSDKKSGTPEIGNVDAVGKVVMEGLLFADGTTFHTTSDSLARRLNDQEKTETTDLKSTGESLVHVKAGASTIESRFVRITRVAKDEGGRSEFELGGKSEFEDVERSDLAAGSGQHLSLKCDRLTTFAEPDATGKTSLRRIVAQKHVRLGGLMAAPGATGDPGSAEADLFEWDAVAQRGFLEATPLVRVTQGASLITAPKILLESPTIFVLKGPKQVHLIQERDGVKEDYFATCEGDLVLDQSTHRLTMRDRCVIRTKEMLLHSDRVNAKLTESGGAQGLESLLALGSVRALRRQDHTTLYGDRLAYRFKDQDLRIYGNPRAVADSGRTVLTQEQIRVYEKENPATKQMTRYTEFVGGAEGFRIDMEEKPSDRPAPAPKKHLK